MEDDCICSMDCVYMATCIWGGIRRCVERKILCAPKGHDDNEKMCAPKGQDASEKMCIL